MRHTYLIYNLSSLVGVPSLSELQRQCGETDIYTPFVIFHVKVMALDVSPSTTHLSAILTYRHLVHITHLQLSTSYRNPNSSLIPADLTDPFFIS